MISHLVFEAISKAKEAGMQIAIGLAPEMVVFGAMREIHRRNTSGVDMPGGEPYAVMLCADVLILGVTFPKEHALADTVTFWTTEAFELPAGCPLITKDVQPQEPEFESILWGVEMDEWLGECHHALALTLKHYEPILKAVIT